MEAKIPIWLDCDPGHDDAFAILLAAYHPRAELLGVSTVHGNSSLKNTTYNAQSILEAIGRRDIKVYPGSAKPIQRDAVHAVDIHGESGLDGVTLLPKPVTPAKSDGEFLKVMYEALKATVPKTAYVISTGTMTNVGLLFTKYPDLAEHIKGVSVMGGAVGGGFTNAPLGKVKGEGERFGNWTPYAEFNIYCDPEAAAVIFHNPTLSSKTTLVTLDLSHQVLATEAVRNALLFQTSRKTVPSTLRIICWQILGFFADTYAEVFALTDGPPLHDPLAVAAILEPEIFNSVRDGREERFDVEIVTEGVHAIDPSQTGELGRTKVQRVPMGADGVRIPRGVDVARFWGLIEDCLQKADAASPLSVLSPEEAKQHGVVLDSS